MPFFALLPPWAPMNRVCCDLLRVNDLRSPPQSTWLGIWKVDYCLINDYAPRLTRWNYSGVFAADPRLINKSADRGPRLGDNCRVSAFCIATCVPGGDCEGREGRPAVWDPFTDLGRARCNERPTGRRGRIVTQPETGLHRSSDAWRRVTVKSRTHLIMYNLCVYAFTCIFIYTRKVRFQVNGRGATRISLISALNLLYPFLMWTYNESWNLLELLTLELAK